MVRTEPFDPASYLGDIDDQIDLLCDARASGDSAYIEHARSVVARAGGRVLDDVIGSRAPSIMQAFRGQHGFMRQPAA